MARPRVRARSRPRSASSALASEVLEVARRLEAHYGAIPWRSHGDPLEVLIGTILSQNTNDGNRDRAFSALKACYPDWKQVLEAPTEELAQTIRPAGLHRQKAPRIQAVLRTLYEERGDFDLGYLRALSREAAFEELTRFRGVGPKTAGIVLTFSLKKPYFPVDTHIRRITRRLGWVRSGEDPHDVMNALVPEELVYPFHLHLIRHGRETCKARKPLCEPCVIRDLCPVYTEGTPP